MNSILNTIEAEYLGVSNATVYTNNKQENRGQVLGITFLSFDWL
jgi:hypothetical protein